MAVYKDYVKLSGDGTFRLVHTCRARKRRGDTSNPRPVSWIVIPLGFLAKRYSSGAKSSRMTFRSRFFEAALAVVNKESQVTYGDLFASFMDAMRAACGVDDIENRIRQYHADLHEGERLAVEALFPRALRVADYPHFTGRTTQRKCADGSLGPPRSGVFAFCTKHFQNKKLVHNMRAWIATARVAPTQLALHTLSALIFITLRASGEATGTIKELQQLYYKTLSASEARARFGMQSWCGGDDVVWTADWWAGYENIQPGSACGTTPQEAWHRWTLRKACPIGRSSPAQFVESAASLFATKVEEPEVEKAKGRLLSDAPCNPEYDTYLMEGEHLAKEARTGAIGLWEKQCYAKWHDASDGTSFYYVRKSLWQRPANVVPDVSGLVHVCGLGWLGGARALLGGLCVAPKAHRYVALTPPNTRPQLSR